MSPALDVPSTSLSAVPVVTMPSSRIALFIDADNIPPSAASQILSALAPHGRVVLRNAHGNWKSGLLNGWSGTIAHCGLRAIQHFGYVPGKNGADAALIIDAMDALHCASADAFALATSDSDFTPLAIRLRSAGCKVFGFGGPQTPRAFQMACSQFELIGKGEPARFSGLAKPLAAAITAHAGKDGWANLSRVASDLSLRGVRPRTWGHRKLLKLLKACGLVELMPTAGDKDYQIRWRP